MRKKSTTNKARVLIVFTAFMVLFIVVFSLGVFVGKGLNKQEIQVTTRYQEQERPVAEIPIEEDESQEPALVSNDFDADSDTGLEEESPKTSASPEETPRVGVVKPDSEEAAQPEITVSPPEVDTEARLAEITEEIRRETEKTEPEQKGRSSDIVLPAVDPKGFYTVQIGSFRSQEQANSFAGSLKSKGYPVFIKSMTTPDNEKWYRVRVGTFGDIETAKNYGDGLKTIEPEVKLFFITVNN